MIDPDHVVVARRTTPPAASVPAVADDARRSSSRVAVTPECHVSRVTFLRDDFQATISAHSLIDREPDAASCPDACR